MNNNNKYKFIYLLIASLLIFIPSCKKENRWDCIKRTGTIITETRSLSGFTKIYVETNVKVFLTQGTAFEIKVEAGENIAPLVATEVIDNTLFIRNNNRCGWARSYDKPMNVYVTMPLISEVTSDGVNDIIGLNAITNPDLQIYMKNSGNIELIVNNIKVGSHMHGAGDLTLKGATGEHACDIGGTGFLHCEELQTDYTWVHTFTTGLCYVKAEDLLICLIDNVGDVLCYGTPTAVQQNNKGTGRLILK